MIRPLIEELYTSHNPIELFARFKEAANSFFLDSSHDPAKLGRWSFIGCDPFLVCKAKRGFVELNWASGKFERLQGNPFLLLKGLFERFKLKFHPFTEIPFLGGGVGYFSYDLKDFIEELPDIAIDDLGLPDCVICLYDCIIAVDNLNHKTYLVSCGLPELNVKENHLRAKRRLGWMKEMVSGAPLSLTSESGDPRSDIYYSVIWSNFTRSSYMKAIERAKEYIRSGDIYQVNLSQRFMIELKEPPFSLYSRLRTVSPAPFSSYLNFGDLTILSSSPERFLKIRGDCIETRPIKGTRPRGRDASQDISLERELLASEKDRAEHVMIVDLERNDLGRICRFSTVHPSEFIIIERYSTVFHLVSTISGRLKKGVTPIGCLLATFPGGSITGAPKIRAMEIIEELEPTKRSVYTGAIGYIGFDGDMDTSIVIRTALVKGDKMYFQVGGGIVADSDPEAEYQETLDKAQGLLRTLKNQTEKPDRVLCQSGTGSRANRRTVPIAPVKS